MPQKGREREKAWSTRPTVAANVGCLAKTTDDETAVPKPDPPGRPATGNTGYSVIAPSAKRADLIFLFRHTHALSSKHPQNEINHHSLKRMSWVPVGGRSVQFNALCSGESLVQRIPAQTWKAPRWRFRKRAFFLDNVQRDHGEGQVFREDQSFEEMGL
ncbi:uncharacterized protein J3R85_000517 [Psidium guajava]|nr:uncharacterized protein J3R85_000517 [Psidium guajava]